MRNSFNIILIILLPLILGTLVLRYANSTYASPDDKNPQSIEQNSNLLTEGAGKSNKIPSGLVSAPGIDKKLVDTKYNRLQLTDNSNDDLYTRVNDAGIVVWGTFDENGVGNIYFYDGERVNQLTFDSGNWFPQINSHGDIVWMHYDGNDSEIYLYAKETDTITRITDNDYDDTFDWSNSYPIKNFNDNKQIAWKGGSGPLNNEIFLYDDGVVTQLTNNSIYDHLPRINENGQVAWIGGGHVYLYDGTVKQITNSGFSKDEPAINDNGDIVWMDWVDGHLNSEIYLYNYSSNSTTRITNNNNTDTNPKINNLGHIIWESWINENPNDREIFYYDGNTIEQLTTTSGSEQKSYLNNNGLSVWENPTTPPENDFELFTHQYGEVGNVQLTNNLYNDAFPYLNDNNQIVWQWFDGNDFEIFLAKPLP